MDSKLKRWSPFIGEIDHPLQYVSNVGQMCSLLSKEMSHFFSTLQQISTLANFQKIFNLLFKRGHQNQSSNDNVDQIQTKFEFDCIHNFCQHISRILSSMDLLDSDSTFFEYLSYEVIPNINVLRPCMINLILC